MDAYGCRVNSLFLVLNSLFFKIFSLLNSVGNCSRSRCSTAVTCYEIGSLCPEIAKFPVKFPVSREFQWRRVRSALRRQPASPDLREAVPALSFWALRPRWKSFQVMSTDIRQYEALV